MPTLCSQALNCPQADCVVGRITVIPGHIFELWEQYSNIRKYKYGNEQQVNTFKPEVSIVIFIHYKPRIAVAILDL